jgi:type II secretory pathway pseudopilin PulG
MMTSRKHRQQGFFLTALTAVLSVIAFIFILAYSSYYAKRSTLTLVQSQQAYLYEAKARLLEAYAAHAENIDADSSASAYRSGDAWLALAGISPKWEIAVGVSDRLTKEGVKYTSVTLWLPSEDDGTNPASYDKSTGTFKSCATAPCASRVYTSFDGLGIQLNARNRTYAILNAAAVKAQSYFKARYMTDVVRDISINHFRAPRGDCGSISADEMPCIADFTAVKNTDVPRLIGLDTQALTNAWGRDIEVTNLSGGSNTAVAPYTMAFRTSDPWGGPPIVIYAVQPL